MRYLIFLFIMLVGCNAPPKSKLLPHQEVDSIRINWDSVEDDTSEKGRRVEYYLDDKYVGSDDLGLAVIHERLGQLRNGGAIFFEPVMMGYDSFAPSYLEAVPLYNENLSEDELRSAVKKKNLMVVLI